MVRMEIVGAHLDFETGFTGLSLQICFGISVYAYNITQEDKSWFMCNDK